MPTITVTLQIDVTAHPIAGTLRAGGDPRPVPFTGWVQLTHLLGQLACTTGDDERAAGPA